MNLEEEKATKTGVKQARKLYNTENQDLLNYLMLLRYGTNTPHEGCSPILNIKSVSEVSGIKYSTVRGLLKHGVSLLSQHKTAKLKLKTKLQQNHLEYLANPSILTSWASLTIKQRVSVF